MTQAVEKNILACLDKGVVKLTTTKGDVKELPLDLFCCYQRHLPLQKRKWLAQVGLDGCDLKEKYQTFTQLYSITPSKMQHLGERLWYKYVMTRFGETLIKKLGFNLIGIAPNRINRIEYYYDKLKVAVDDKQINMLPLVFHTGLSVKEIKDSISKSAWKKLINNAFSRNKLIAARLEGCNSSLVTSKLELLVDIPSSILLHKRPFGHMEGEAELAKWVAATAKSNKCMQNRFEVNKLCTLFYDTRRMCHQRGIAFNSSWGFKRMQETHTMLTRDQVQAREIRDKELAYKLSRPIEYSNLPLKSFTYLDGSGNVSVELLSSGSDIKQEGRDMHHCVGSYSGLCIEESYAVFRLTSASGRSTIGLSLVGDKFRVQQHYAACNKEPSQQHKEVEKFIIKYLEKE